jgi:uncharacterized protein with FMN-binding domain
MKKIALSLAVIAASGAYALKEASLRYDWLGQASAVTIAARDPLLAAPSPSAGSSPPLSVAPVTAPRAPGDPGRVAVTTELPQNVAMPAWPVPVPLAGLAQPIANAPAARPAATAAAVIGPPNPTLAPPAASTGAKAPGSQFRDGSFTGSPFDAYWGTVQVRAVVKDGRLLSVDVLSYPSDRNRSQQINRYALPLLQREVVQAQGVKVNIVSGATLTTSAYLNSLRSALTLAQ